MILSARIAALEKMGDEDAALVLADQLLERMLDW
jgi:hypothetical protein